MFGYGLGDGSSSHTRLPPESGQLRGIDDDRDRPQEREIDRGKIAPRQFAFTRVDELDVRPEMADRADLIECDFEEKELPTGHDFAFLGQIVHGITAEGNQELFENVARATTDRGTVGILDQVADPPLSGRLPFNPLESSFADGIAALLGFGLFVFTGGRSYPYDDLETWLAEAGFSEVSYRGVRQSPGMSPIIARKPGSG